MFARWKNARLRAAERALDEGRFDFAWEQLRELSDEDRRAVELKQRLARALLARVRLDNQAGDRAAALEGLQQLKELGQYDDEARLLEARISDEQQRDAHQRQQRQAARRRVERDVAAGNLETGRLNAERLAGDPGAQELRHELDVRLARAGQLIEQARAALQADDVATACRFWDEANRRHGRSQAVDQMLPELGRACQRVFEQHLRAGELAALTALMEACRPAISASASLGVFQHAAELIGQAAGCLAREDYDGLHEALLRLRATCRGAEWIETALSELEQMARLRASLLAGPLGALAEPVEKSTQIGKPAAAGIGDNAARPAGALAETVVSRGAPLNRPLLLLIDGTGSSVILSREVVQLGRAGGAARPDVPIPGDIWSHHADVLREGDDYFLVAHGPVTVNQRPVQRVLLRHGDRIRLGAAAKLTFSQPSAASGTAVLKLSSRCRLPQDVSEVVLFKDTCLIGPQATCHIRTREGDTRLVLFERDGRLVVRRAGRDGRGTGPVEPLVAGAVRDVGDLRLTIKDYEPGPAPGRAGG